MLCHLSRRSFVQSAAAAAAAIAGKGFLGDIAFANDLTPSNVLSQFGYGDVILASDLHESQLHRTHSVLMQLSDDSLLKPFRQMAGMPAPGEDLGGWYHYDPDLDHFAGDYGFAPACTFGQWISALARVYAITGDGATRAKVLRLNQLYAATISPDFYIKNRFLAYCYDKLVLGLLDSHSFANDRTSTTNPGTGTSPTRCRRIYLSRTSVEPVDGITTSDSNISTTKPGTNRCRAA